VVLKGRLLAVEARTAHDRFGLTHSEIVHVRGPISKAIRYKAMRAGRRWIRSLDFAACALRRCSGVQ